jgi:acetyl-CoA carboxylase biotin carboxyl carrier protein
MTAGNDRSAPDTEAAASLWAEARDLIRRLEGSSVQRLAVEIGELKLEIERGIPTLSAPIPFAGDSAGPVGGPVAMGAFSGPGIAPEARGASGVFAAIGGEPDNRIPVLSPLVGTFYRAQQPGAKPFVEEGDSVESGKTLCIVEAMKLMNEVTTQDSGRVVEVLADNGDWVEFEQVLMYLEPNGDA